MKLSTTQIETPLHHLNGWKSSDANIQKQFEFADFIDAMTFVNRVAELAEEVGHHPDLDIRYNRVLVALSTHDEGGVTDKDLRLAREIEELV